MLQRIFFLCLFSVAFATNRSELYVKAVKNLYEKFNSDYNPQIHPNLDNITVVSVNMFVRSIERIDDSNMEYAIQVTLRQLWSDPRLSFEDREGKIRYLILNDPSQIWLPDLFFANEKKAHFHNIVTPNIYLRISSNGDVLYSTRISLKLSCPMDLKKFPMDEQVCTLRVASYAWTTDDVVIFWGSDNAVQVGRGLLLPRFVLQGYYQDYCSTKTIGREYSCLKVEFLFKRHFLPYFLQIYMPCSVLILVSWLPFWLERDALLARVFMGATTLCTVILFLHNINNSLPTVSYLKSVDIFTNGCLFFALASFIAVILTNQPRSTSQPIEIKDFESSSGVVRKSHFVRFRELVFGDANCSCRILFPAAFMVFVFICCGTSFSRSHISNNVVRY